MKTLKKLHTLLAMIAICLCFTACTNDDDDDGGNSDDSSLIGTWAYEDEEDEYYIEVTFKSNGTFISYEEDYYWGEEDEDRGTYTVKGNKLTIEYDDGDVETCTFSVTSKKLTIKYKDGDETYTEVYYRID